MQVFDIEDLGRKGGEGKAVVARPRDCTMCRSSTNAIHHASC